MPRIVPLALSFALLGGGALAEPAPLPVPQGPVILRVSGQIGVTNADETAEFDLEMLQQLGPETLRSSTPWTEGEQVFRGVPLHRLTERLGITAGLLLAKAIND